MSKVKIAVLGSLIYDCTLWGPRLPKKGETVAGYRNGFAPGGKGANQAVQAAKLGADVYMIGKVGADASGEILLKSLKDNGVHTDFITVTENEGTGTCAIMVDDNGDNAIMTALQANMTITADEIREAVSRLGEFDVFLTQLETSMESIDYALREAKKAGIKVVLNSAPALDVPDEFFRGCDYVTPNETEAERYTGFLPAYDDKVSTKKAADVLLAKGAKNVAFTLGSQGSYFTDGTKEIYMPSYKITAVDPTAAGDAYNAAFVCKIAAGADVETAMKYANAAGAIAASKAGAQPSLGTKEEMEAFLAARGIVL